MLDWKYTWQTNQNILMNNKTDVIGWYSQISQINFNNASSKIVFISMKCTVSQALPFSRVQSTMTKMFIIMQPRSSSNHKWKRTSLSFSEIQLYKVTKTKIKYVIFCRSPQGKSLRSSLLYLQVFWIFFNLCHWVGFEYIHYYLITNSGSGIFCLSEMLHSAATDKNDHNSPKALCTE